jgi:hypothetical protein
MAQTTVRSNWKCRLGEVPLGIDHHIAAGATAVIDAVDHPDTAMAIPPTARSWGQNRDRTGGCDHRAAYPNTDRSYTYSDADRHGWRGTWRRGSHARDEGSSSQHERERAQAKGTDRR